MDVNPERAEDVLEHKRFLELARSDRSGSPIIHVRSIHVSIWLVHRSSKQYDNHVLC